MYRKYIFENFKMMSNYRQYKSFVPDYLHDRPRSVIKHCLERKSKSQKYIEMTLDVSVTLKVFLK